MSYAKGTVVPVDKSKAEVEQTLKKYGADQFSSGWTSEKAVILFRMKDRYIHIEVPLPKLESSRGNLDRKKGHFYCQDKLDAEIRRRWRAMVLYLKAKMESVDSQIVSFEQAFMSHIMLPNKQTVGEFMLPQIQAAYGSGDMPKQLPGY